MRALATLALLVLLVAGCASSGDSRMTRVQVELEPVDGAQTRVLVTPARSGSYGGTQSRRLTEDFFELLEAQGFTPSD